MNLFAYGTLMWPEILADVIGRSMESTPAVLRNVRRLRVRDQVYPSVVAEPGAQVEGVLYTGLTDMEMASLDQFEGCEYEQRLVEIQTANGPVNAAVYFTSEKAMVLLEKDEWHPDHLPQSLVERFRSTYKGWR
jgi:gamma-glutamylcyclotransferase (GGCT)/AIG2-like uncharacterized protein YtfP